MQTRINLNKKNFLITFFYFLLSINNIYGGEGIWNNFLDKFSTENNQNNYFISSALYYDKIKNSEIEIFYIIQVGKPNGLVVEVSLSEVINIFEINYNLEKNLFIVGDVQGGTWSINRATEIIKLINDSNYSIIKGDRIVSFILH